MCIYQYIHKLIKCIICWLNYLIMWIYSLNKYRERASFIQMHSFSGSLLCITVSYYFLNVNVQYFSILVRCKDLIRQCFSGKTKTRNEVTCWTLIYLSVESGCLCGLNLFQEFNIIKRGKKTCFSNTHIN